MFKRNDNVWAQELPNEVKNLINMAGATEFLGGNSGERAKAEIQIRSSLQLVKVSKNLTNATIMLAVVTAVLVIVTAIKK